MDIKTEILDLCRRAKVASCALANLTTRQKNDCLVAMAAALEKNASVIKAANAKDVEAGRSAGLSAAILDRLALDDKRITDMAKGVHQVAALPDPVGQTLNETVRPNGLKIRKVSVPIGVIAIIYESRPNVTADSAALCFKSGNATILRGGKEAIHSNRAIVDVMLGAENVGQTSPSARSSTQSQTRGLHHIIENAIQLVSTTDREAVRILAQAEGLVDLLIPRGGEGLVRAVAEVARVPVIKHYKGVCHVFVDEAADPDMAEKIVVNAKCQRPATCNAMETLLVHEKIAPKILPRLAKALADKKVELRCDAKTMEILSKSPTPNSKSLILATEDDWYAEYLDLILAVRVVPNVDAAVEHISKYGSAHSDAIVTENKATAENFLKKVDSAAVFWNASTRFTDGGEFGMGAEIGISTDKIGARGPMGLEELTSYKYVVVGDGQVRQ